MNAVRLFVRDYAFPIQAIVIGTVAYTTGVVVNLVTQKADNTPAFWIVFAGGLTICVILVLLSAAFDRFMRRDDERLKREYNTHRSGYVTLNREMSEYIRIVRSVTSGDATLAQAPIQLMQNACKDLHDTLEAEYGLGVSVSEHIEFEVTFMTESIDDRAITIAAWANRDARAPKSLARRKNDPNTYVGTETEKLYKDPNRTPRFISSTNRDDYKELYPGQKIRIRSSVIYPVVCDEFSLQGALVVHCDRENFFRPEADKLWRELLEPYTKRLALARVAADRVKRLGLPISF